MSSNDVQTVVVGAGAIGSATAHWLAERGQDDVLVLEQWALGHANGGSEDHSRIIRHSYHNSTYGRLTRAAYDSWARLEHTAARRLESFDGGVRVHTDTGSHTADHVVVATAWWTDDLLHDLGQTWRTTISQEQVCYFATPAIKDFSIGRFPLWVWHGEVVYYGFPVYGEVAIKVSRDVTGNFVTQQTRTHEPSAEETEFLAAFVRSHLPTGAGRELYSKTCVYDMPPDRDFIIDALPGHPRIIVGNGAGHAAKFSGWFGEVLSELVVDGRSSHPIEAFRADRPQLVDPAFTPAFALRG